MPRPITETGVVPFTLIPCEPYEVSQYNLCTGKNEPHTVIGYGARISDESFEEFGASFVSIHGGKFIVIGRQFAEHHAGKMMIGKATSEC